MLTFLGWLSDLQLGDEKGTLNHLDGGFCCPAQGRSWSRDLASTFQVKPGKKQQMGSQKG